MGLRDLIRRVLTPAETVADATPPTDPNSLGAAEFTGARGPSVYFNQASGAGLPGDPSWWSQWRYPRRLTERQRESFARDALIRRGLSLKANAATGEGWRAEIKTDDDSIDPDKLADEIQDYEDRKEIALSAAIADALFRADMHGFAIIWLGIQDGSDPDGTDFTATVSLDSIKTIAWARVFDSRDVDIKGIHGVESGQFGKPTAYIIQNIEGVLPEGWRGDKSNTADNIIQEPVQFPDGVAQIEVHASRCLLFTAPDGVPVPDSIQSHFANYFTTQAAIARGASDFSISVYKIKNWVWQARNRDQQSSVERITAVDRMKSMFHAVILDDANESYERLGGAAVSGLEKMVNPAMVDIAAALGISVTQFWGVSPGGFGTGQSERENFHTEIRVEQKNDVAPELRVFHTYVLLADDGPQVDVRPESREIVFADLSPADEVEIQTILTQRVTITLAAVAAMVMTPEEGAETLASLNTADFSFKIDLDARAKPEPGTTTPGATAPDGEPEGDLEDVVEEPDELEVAFSKDPLPTDAGKARELAERLSEQLGTKVPTGRITRLARAGKIRAWSILGGAPLFSLREVLKIVAQENGLMPPTVTVTELNDTTLSTTTVTEVSDEFYFVDAVETVLDPFPNEHAARIREPDTFEPGSFRRRDIDDPAGVSMILGMVKGGDGLRIQSFRFDRTKWTPADAKAWLTRNDYPDFTFEEASDE